MEGGDGGKGKGKERQDKEEGIKAGPYRGRKSIAL